MNTKEGYNHILTHVGYDKDAHLPGLRAMPSRSTRRSPGPYLGDMHACQPITAASSLSRPTTATAGAATPWIPPAPKATTSSSWLWSTTSTDTPGAGRLSRAAPTTLTTRYWLRARGKASSDAIGFDNQHGHRGRAPPRHGHLRPGRLPITEDVFVVNNWGPEVPARARAPTPSRTRARTRPSTSTQCASEDNTVDHHRREGTRRRARRPSCSGHAPDRLHHAPWPAAPTARGGALTCRTSP